MIRVARDSDAERIREIYTPAVVETVTSFEIVVPTVDDMAGRIRELGKTYPWLVHEQDGEVSGYAYACPHRSRQAYQWCVEVSAYVDAAAQRAGIGRALYERLFEILRAQGFRNAYAGVTQPNPASVNFHRALGFETVGTYGRIGFKNGAWRDVIWLGLRLQDGPEPPSTPILFSELDL